MVMGHLFRISNDFRPFAYQCPDPLFQAITQLFRILPRDVVVLPNVKMQFISVYDVLATRANYRES